MSGSVNKVILIGNLGRDPDVRRNGAGDPIVNLRIATSDTWRDRQSGERKERTEWHSVVIFNENLAKVAEQYLKKGSKVYIAGQLATRKWTDQGGVERYTTEVVLQKFRGELVLLDHTPSTRPPAADDADSYGSTSTRQPGPASGAPTNNFSSDLDDDIPF